MIVFIIHRDLIFLKLLEYPCVIVNFMENIVKSEDIRIVRKNTVINVDKNDLETGIDFFKNILYFKEQTFLKICYIFFT